jgi:hypothetical protein
MSSMSASDLTPVDRRACLVRRRDARLSLERQRGVVSLQLDLGWHLTVIIVSMSMRFFLVYP